MEFEALDINMVGNPTVIKVVGTGGAGCNAINRMINAGLKGVSFIACNTDIQSLNDNKAEKKILLGEKLAGGRGAGGNPEIGQKAAEESIDQIIAELEGSDMVFITAGMGGGTGTGSAPIIAKAAKEMDILTVGVITKPFSFEGNLKLKQAELGIDYLGKYVDSLVVVSNDKLMQVCDKNITMQDAFKLADDTLRQGVQGVTEIVTESGNVNVDFADVKSILSNRGITHMGMGIAEGEDRADIAMRAAIESPLLETSVDGAKAVLVNITGGLDLGLFEGNDIIAKVKERVDKDVFLTWGVVNKEEMQGKIAITVFAAGFNGGPSKIDSDYMTNHDQEKKEDKRSMTIDGVPAYETSLQDILRDGDTQSSIDVDIPSFLNKED